MSTAVAMNWLELDRSPHAIQFYSGDGFLCDSLARFVSTALEKEESALVIATDEHRDRIFERLKELGVDTDKWVKKGRLASFDAYLAKTQLVVDGKIDKEVFNKFIEGVVLPLKAAAASKPKRVAACGEIVGLLWEEGKHEAAIELEHLWSHLDDQGCYCLRCYYPIVTFYDPAQNELFIKLLAQHADVIPGDSHLHNVAARVKQFESTGGR
jgi:hypothetical protein